MKLSSAGMHLTSVFGVILVTCLVNVSPNSTSVVTTTEEPKPVILPNQVPLNQASSLDFDLPVDVEFSSVPNSVRSVFIAKYDVRGNFLRLYTGAADLCPLITICTLNPTKSNSTVRRYTGTDLCNSNKYDVLNILPGAKSIKVRRASGTVEEFFSTRSDVIISRNASTASSDKWTFSYTKEWKQYDADVFAEAEFVMGSSIVVFGSSKTCPIYMFSTHDYYHSEGIQESIEACVPPLVEASTKSLDPLIKATVTGFKKDTQNCCERLEDVETFWVPSKIQKPDKRVQVFTLKTKDVAVTGNASASLSVNAMTLEIATELSAINTIVSTCSWVRLCFDFAGGKGCQDPKKILDLMIGKGVYIPTDTDEAFKFSAPPNEITNVMLRFHGSDLLEMGYGTAPHNNIFSTAASHTMRLSYTPSSTASQVALITPAGCKARLTRRTFQSGFTNKLEHVNLHVTKCECQKLA